MIVITKALIMRKYYPLLEYVRLYATAAALEAVVAAGKEDATADDIMDDTAEVGGCTPPLRMVIILLFLIGIMLHDLTLLSGRGVML